MAKKNDKKDLLAFLQGRYGLNNPAEDEVTSSDIKALNLNNPGSFTNYYEDDEDDEELDEWCGFSDLDEMVITDESEDDILEQSELKLIGLVLE